MACLSSFTASPNLRTCFRSSKLPNRGGHLTCSSHLIWQGAAPKDDIAGSLHEVIAARPFVPPVQVAAFHFERRQLQIADPAKGPARAQHSKARPKRRSRSRVAIGPVSPARLGCGAPPTTVGATAFLGMQTLLAISFSFTGKNQLSPEKRAAIFFGQTSAVRHQDGVAQSIR